MYELNHIVGCRHGCKYPCGAYEIKRGFGNISSYEDWIRPKLIYNTLELLDKEIPKMKDKIEIVRLCSATDPFMYGYKEVEEMSLKIIKRLNDANIKCYVLTKGILPKQLAELSKKNRYGISLISINEEFREKIEPNAAPYNLRIRALKRLQKLGQKTFVNISPYPTPNIIEQNIIEILEKVKFVKEIIFGRTNYNKEVNEYKGEKSFYRERVKEIKKYCEKNKIRLRIKEGI